MASAKDATTSPKQDPAAKGGEGVAPNGKPAAPNTPGQPTASVHRSSTAKEVIPFEWKLVGESGGFALTLFKSVEREDVDAQLERVQRDGYYSNLRILGADEKVKQPTSVKARKARRTAKVTKEVEEATKARLAAEASAQAAKSTKKSPASKAGAKSTKAKPKKIAKSKPKAKVKAKPKAKVKAKPKAKAKAKRKPAKKSTVAAKSKSRSKVKAKAKKKR